MSTEHWSESVTGGEFAGWAAYAVKRAAAAAPAAPACEDIAYVALAELLRAARVRAWVAEDESPDADH